MAEGCCLVNSRFNDISLRGCIFYTLSTYSLQNPLPVKKDINATNNSSIFLTHQRLLEVIPPSPTSLPPSTSNPLTPPLTQINPSHCSVCYVLMDRMGTITSSITALTRKRELVSQSQFVFPICLIQLVPKQFQTAWKDKLGLRYELSYSHQCSNAGCGYYRSIGL